MENKPLIEVKNLTTHFSIKGKILQALNDVSLSIYPKETIGLVGESGCGKTTLARTIMRLYSPKAGKIFFEGNNIFTAKSSYLQKLSRDMQYIFQDPFASLNPRMTAEEIIAEPMKIHQKRIKNYRTLVEELLVLVGLDPSHRLRFPHEFSGGQRQRIGIARALALKPRFIVCDEPIAALDVSIQAQIINLLKKLQREMGLTYLFISHDLSMVKHLADRMAVMYLGYLMELAPSEVLYKDPLHPYTRALLSTIPLVSPRKPFQKKSRIVLKGDIPSPLTPPKGCPFCTRCPNAMPICFTKRPKYRLIGKDHSVACHLYPP